MAASPTGGRAQPGPPATFPPGFMEDLIDQPAFYILNRSFPREHVRHAADALSITPITVAIVSDPADVPLALELTPSVLRACCEEEALEMAMTIGTENRALVVGEADVLDAVYSDGRREC